jgi:carbonic anhydrase
MPVADEYLRANQRHAETFKRGHLALPAGRKVAVVVCTDARIDPTRALGLEEGDAYIILNDGGRIADALRSLAISERLLGTEQVVIVHHSDCGIVNFSDDKIRGQRGDKRGVDAEALDRSVRDDLATYRASALVRHDIPVRGFVYDVKTGRLREVQ